MRWSDIPFTPTTRALRQFGGIGALLLAALAVARLHAGDIHGAVLWASLLAVVGVVTVARPSALRWIFVGAMIFTFPIGWVLSRLILGMLFYGLFASVGLFFRWIGRDPLGLKKPAAPTYWVSKSGDRDPRRYFRQF